tara:strand:- start:30 stop:809 length:780 start_codon:yes stop_codon:yes gene_type:complete
MSGIRNSEQTPYKACIYQWIFNPPFEHVLKGCRYIGQTNHFQSRMFRHKYEPSTQFVDKLWQQYPYENYWILEVEERTFALGIDRLFIEAGCWMNDRETELIEKYGGPLRDENERLHQTLNKKSGGGYSIGKRERDRQNARSSLTKVWPRLKDYYDKHGNLNIPENCELENGRNGRKQKLSYEMDYIREGSSCFLQFQNFEEWLNECGVQVDGIPRSNRLVQQEVKYVLDSVISQVIAEIDQSYVTKTRGEISKSAGKI